MRHESSARRWWIGLAAGVLSALALLELATLGVIIIAVVAVLSMKQGRAAVSGLLVGLGLGIFLLLGLAQLRCGQDPHCSGPDVSAWFVAAAVALPAGVLLIAVRGFAIGGPRRL